MQLKQPKTIQESAFNRRNLLEHITSTLDGCQEMLGMMSEVEKLGGSIPVSPMSTIEILIHLAENDVVRLAVRRNLMDYGLHLPLIDFGANPFTPDHLVTYAEIGQQLGFNTLLHWNRSKSL